VDEMRRVGGWIYEALTHCDEPAVLSRIAGEIRELCEHFPVPSERAAEFSS